MERFEISYKPVVLLQPPGLCKTFTRSGSVYPPLGLCQLKAVDCYDLMQVIDAEGLGFSDEQTQQLIKKMQPQIVGLTATSFTLDIVEKWAKFCKTQNAIVIVGGPHARLDPVGIFKSCPSADIVVRGEGECIINELILQILNQKMDKSLPGVCYRNKRHIDSKILKVDDFSKIPFPVMNFLPIANYWCPDALNRPMLTMMTTRGCPYICAFCSSPAVMGKKVRGWSVEQVINELKYLYFELNIKEISFVDDVFTINRKRTLQLCNEMVKNQIRITWFCNARADHIDEEIAKSLQQAGCHQVYLGFESGSQSILDNINKRATIEKLINGAVILKKYGINRSIGFVIGLPGETDDTVTQSIKLAQQIKPERLQFTRFTPLVGSPLENFKFENNGFHTLAEDQVGLWIKRAYEECKAVSWGKESW